MSIAEKLKTIAENEQKVFDAGKKAEYDRFWDAYQENGNRTSYLCAFGGRAWTDETFKPKYPINKISNATNMFWYSAIAHIDCELDFESRYLTLTAMFSSAWVERISKFKSYATLIYAATTFSGCSKLTDISFVEGSVIGTNISFPVSPLSVESMNNVIACLKDYSADGGTHTVTFKADRETMLTDGEKAAATEKGWTLVWN